MQIQEFVAQNDYDGRCATRLVIDGEEIYRLIDGEPEDNTLSRNFSFNVTPALIAAYEAGKRGEEYNQEIITQSWEEFWEN